MHFNLKNKPGVSLIEVLVSVTIFVILMVTALQIFDVVLKGQRRAAATANLQESVKYFLEVIAKEIRMAQAVQNDGDCGLNLNVLYRVSDGNLYLQNYHNECVVYSLVNEDGIGRFQVTRNAQSANLSPAKISISNLSFETHQVLNQQPYVVVSMQARADNGPEPIIMNIQTTIASRYYLP